MSSQARQFLFNAAAGIAAGPKNDHAAEEAAMPTSYKAPGRLGDPSMTVTEDPRLDPRVRVVLEKLGFDRTIRSPLLDSLRGDSTIEEIAALCEQAEAGSKMLYDSIALDLPSDTDEPEIEPREETVPGGDGQDMKLHIYQPAHRDTDKLPGVICLHGGAMTILRTFNRVHDRWCKSLAAEGLVVILTDFRNAWTKEKWNPFPAGLNDCAAAVQWAASNRDSLGISQILIQGESGGGNLSLATALKAKHEGWIDQIAGVFAHCPMIGNLYGATTERKLRELPSLVENQSYVLDMNRTAFMAYYYTGDEANVANPHAWPYHATLEDLKGLPPHIMVMDELDPLRDEGIAYARKLMEAGVLTQSRLNLGMVHGASLILRQAVPEYHHGMARDVAAFAKGL